jgi:hypothetical protein
MTRNPTDNDITQRAHAEALNWPEPANEFFRLYAQAESTLKQAGHLSQRTKLAHADWESFARALGQEFFESIRDSGNATTLILEPPRRRMKDGLTFQPDRPPAIETTEQLFKRGVCQVRHNLAHGEKFDVSGVGWDRDLALVSESLRVLQLALQRNRNIRQF